MKLKRMAARDTDEMASDFDQLVEQGRALLQDIMPNETSNEAIERAAIRSPDDGFAWDGYPDAPCSRGQSWRSWRERSPTRIRER